MDGAGPVYDSQAIEHDLAFYSSFKKATQELAEKAQELAETGKESAKVCTNLANDASIAIFDTIEREK